MTKEQDIKALAEIIDTCPIRAEEKGIDAIYNCGRNSCGECAAQSLYAKGYRLPVKHTPLGNEEIKNIANRYHEMGSDGDTESVITAGALEQLEKDNKEHE